MTDMLSRIKGAIENDETAQVQTPIVDNALNLVNDTSTLLADRLPTIYQWIDDAVAAGGAEQERAGDIIESLYASASASDMNVITAFEQALN